MDVRDIDAVLDEYHHDPEAAHGDEDKLLWDFVRARADAGDGEAFELLRLYETERTRWYA